MRLALLALIAIVFSAESFAQRAPRGPRYNPPGRPDYRPGPGPIGRPDYRPVPDYRPSPGPVYRPGPDYRPGPGGRVVIRNTYRPGRVYRDYRRGPIVWTTPFGYSCSMYGDLLLNGIRQHTFSYSMDCNQAISDIRIYGDYCDNDIMYDQSGYMEAQFYSNYECREALGYYY